MSLHIAIAATPDADQPRFLQLADRLQLPVQSIDTASAKLLVTVTGERVELRQTDCNAPGPVYADFVGGKAAHRRKFGGGRGTHLARAVGIKPGYTPAIIDATAGLGRDAFVFATLGCQVTLVEQSPIIATLLEDGLRRAGRVHELTDTVRRMKLIQADSTDYLKALTPDHYPDTVYLDPMYPHSGKSALAKKEMRLFQELIGPDLNGSELLQLARHRTLKRVTVKRPIKAPCLGNIKPDADIRSKNTRYDLYWPVKN